MSIIRPDRLQRVLLISLDVRGHYSMALPCLKGYAEADPDIASVVNIRHLSFTVRGKGTRILKEVLRAVYSYRPQIIAFSCNIWNASLTRLCCRWLRMMLPRPLLVLGGQEIVPPFDEIIRDYKGADILIQGEGEGPFRALLKCLLEKGSEGLERVKGLYYRSADGDWKHTGLAERITDLDSIPSPYLSGNVQMSGYPAIGAMIEISRGCPMKCSFCFEASRYKRSFSFSMERVADEITYLRKRGHRRFHILDPILSLKNRIPEVHEALRNIDMRGTETSCEIYAEMLKTEHVPLLDFVDICDIGLQTISTAGCATIQRPFLKERFERGYRSLKSHGKRVNIYLLAGIPGDTLQTFKEGVDYAQSLKPTRLFLNQLLVLRGTPLRNHADEYGLIYDPAPPYLATSSTSFPAQDLEVAHRYCREASMEMNRPKRNAP